MSKMENKNSGDIVWAKTPSHPWLPGRICKEEIPANLIIGKCQGKDTICVFLFGIHEYAWIKASSIQNYSENFKRHQKQRLYKHRRTLLENAMNEAERYISEPGFKYTMLAHIKQTSNNATEAIQLFRSALKHNSMDSVTFFEFFHCLRTICDWNEYDKCMSILRELVEHELRTGKDICIDTHSSLFYPFSPATHKAIAQQWAELDALEVHYWNRNYKHSDKKVNRLKIGYVSSDYRDHSTSHLIQSIPGLHNRQRFEVYCYALNGDDGSPYYKKISREAEHFIDLSNKTDVQAADRIHSHGIHILINLNGHTEGSRNEIFAFRPAPIQVMWLGFPCTMGAIFMDYFIGDAITTPTKFADHYTEQLAHMPHTYFIGDHKQMFPHLIDKIHVIEDLEDNSSYNSAVINGTANLLNENSGIRIRAIETSDQIRKMIRLKEPQVKIGNVSVLNSALHSEEMLMKSVILTSREQYGLPLRAIVFCNFNNLYKLDPRTFESWLRILEAVQNSVLWLLRVPREVETNIRQAAKDFGFKDVSRFIFSDITSKEEHVRRSQLADISLDTTICNGHTTTMDMLWSGTPIVTLIGETLASRASASILTTLGCSKLVAKDFNEYEQIAIHLGNNPFELRALQVKISELRVSSPLFNCVHYVRDWENLLESIWKNHAKGNPPRFLAAASCLRK